jgi:hypothetical protein
MGFTEMAVRSLRLNPSISENASRGTRGPAAGRWRARESSLSSEPDDNHGSGRCLAHLPQRGHLVHRGAAALRPTPSQTLSKERPSVSGSNR